MQALFVRILLLALGLCNISEVQAGLGSSSMWTAHFEYDVMGRESLRRLLGGVESRTRYDRSGHVTDQVTQGVGYEVSHRSYDWDLSGKLRKLTAGSYTAEFDYDVVGTLAAARYNETDILYKLPDRIGNIYPDRFANARELLTRGIRELKRVYPEIPNSQLQELIDLNKSMYPEMNKPPRGKL